MSFGQRLVLLVSFFLTATVAGTLWVAIANLDTGVKQRETVALEAVTAMTRSLIEHSGALALAQAELLARQPENVVAIAAGDRDRLVAMQANLFAYLKAEAGIDIIQYQKPDLTTLVRLQDPSRYGDDVSKLRPMVLSAHHDRRGQTGIEIGPTRVLALRGVAPVFDGATFVGTAEVGLSLAPLFQAVKTITGCDIAVIVPTGPGALPTDTRPVIGDTVISDSTDNGLFGRLLRVVSVKQTREDQQLDQSLDGVDYGLAATPLLNYSGQPIGAILVLRDFSALHAEFVRRLWVMVFIAVSGLIVSYSIVSVAVGGLLTRPLAALADHAEAAAKAEKTPAMPPMAGDLGRIAAAIDTLVARAQPKEPEAEQTT